MPLPAEFLPVDPESVERAKADCYAERARVEALTGLTIRDDGRLRKPCDIVVMPKIPRGSVDLRVRCSVALENLERYYGKELFWSRVELLREAK